MKLNTWGRGSNFKERKQEENKTDETITKDFDAEKKVEGRHMKKP